MCFRRSSESQIGQVLPVLGISHAFVSVWLGIGLILTVVYAIEKMALLGAPSIALGLGAVAVVGALAGAFRWAYLDGAIDIDPLLPALVVIVIAFLAGTPVAFVLAIGGVLYFLIKGDVPMVDRSRRLSGGHRRLPPAVDPLLHAGRRADGHQRHGQAAGRHGPALGRALDRRPPDVDGGRHLHVLDGQRRQGGGHFHRRHHHEEADARPRLSRRPNSPPCWPPRSRWPIRFRHRLPCLSWAR